MSSTTNDAVPEAFLAYIAASVDTGEWRVWVVAKVEDLAGVTCQPLRPGTATASVRYRGACPSCTHPTEQVIPLTFLTVDSSWKSIAARGPRATTRKPVTAENRALAPAGAAEGSPSAELR